MQAYDLIVIGSGPGGQRAAIQGAKAGKRVAMIEKQAAVGGVCINIGTIPSKTMREAVLHLSGFYSKNFYGANHTSQENITMADLNFRVQRVVENEVSVTQDQLKRNGVEVIHGFGNFTDPHHVRVETSNGYAEFEAQYIVIATGTKPAANTKVPINGRNIIDSDQILSMPQVPRTLIVVGGGVIGAEYACMFATLGVRVIIVEKRPRLLEFADVEMVEALTYHTRDQRATLRLTEEARHWRRAALRRRTARQRRSVESARSGDPSRRTRTHQSRCGLPHRAAAHLCRRRRHRFSEPRFRVHGAGPHRGRARV